MTGTVAVAALAGAGTGAGLCALWAALHPRFGRRPQSRRPALSWPGWARARAAVASATGLAVGVLTRWPVAALAAGVAVWAVRGRGRRTPRSVVARLEALASWIESLRDVVAGGVGLEQAIDLTAATAPPPIDVEVGTLAGRLRAHRPLSETLRLLADDLDDGTADRVVAALLMAAGARGPGLVAVLDHLAAATRDQVTVRRQIDASRRSTGRAVQIILGLTGAMVGALMLANPGYLAVYADPLGQLVLALALGFIGAGLAWIRHLDSVDAPARYFAPSSPRGVR